MELSYKQICETLILRYEQGGFVQSDYVKFKSNVMKHPDIASRPQGYRELIMQMIESKLNVRISAIKPVRFATGNAATNTYLADIVLEDAPGMMKPGCALTVPVDVLEVATPYNLWPNVPQDIVHDYNTSNDKPAATDQTMADDSHRQLRQK